MQEVRWRDAVTRSISGKDTQYKLFWIGNQEGNGGVGVMLAEKWIQKVIHVNRINDRLMLLKVFVGKRVVTIISTYAPQQGLSDDCQRKNYMQILYYILQKLTKNVIILQSLIQRINLGIGRYRKAPKAQEHGSGGVLSLPSGSRGRAAGKMLQISVTEMQFGGSSEALSRLLAQSY